MIRYKVKTYLESQAGKFVVEFSILDSIGGLNLFVYSTVAGASEFSHVASVFDLENHPELSPILGNQYYRAPSAIKTFDSAFKAQEFSQKVVEDLVSLGSNLEDISTQFSSEDTFKIENGVSVKESSA